MVRQSAFVFVLVLLASTLVAETPPAGSSVLAMGSMQFDIFASTTDIPVRYGGDGIYRYGITGTFVGTPSLPDGGIVLGVELEACDTSPSEEVQMYFEEVTNGLRSVAALITTGVQETPGCGRIYHALASPLQIKNQQSFYMVLMRSSPNAKFAGVRFYYKPPASGLARLFRR